MKKTLRLLIISTVYLPLLVFSKLSIADATEAFAACAKESDSLKRLMCYDKASQTQEKKEVVNQLPLEEAKPKVEVVKPKPASTIYEGQTPTNSATAKSSEPPRVEAESKEVDALQLVKPEAPAVISTGQTPTTAVEAPKNMVTFDAEDTFGEEEKVVRQSLEEVTFTVANLSKNQYKQWILTFSNDQVWAQKDDDKYIKFSVGDKVKIKKGVFGAFYLNDADGDRRIRVKRIK